jgi:hypothetical protein
LRLLGETVDVSVRTAREGGSSAAVDLGVIRIRDRTPPAVSFETSDPVRIARASSARAEPGAVLEDVQALLGRLK